MAHVNATNINANTRGFNTVLVFRTQQLMDLWVNEMQGQISDGMWENCRNTEWLWKNEAHVLGDKTEVFVADRWSIGRTNYPLSGQLWSCVGDRILEENGFADKKEATKAWKEILEAIQNARVMTEDERKVYVEDCQTRGRDVKKILEEKAAAMRSKLIEHFEEQTFYSDYTCLGIRNVAKGRTAWIEPIYSLRLNSVTYKVYVDSNSIVVDSYEKILEAVELLKNFYTTKAELEQK